VSSSKARASKIAVLFFALLGLAVMAATLGVVFTPLPEELAHPLAREAASVRVLDRHQKLLREVRGDDAIRSAPITREELGDLPAKAILACEDARFYAHVGVDPLAVVRAGLSALRRGRIVSGASTLTMQLARLLRPHPRTFRGKVGEMLLALRIEASIDKDRILTEYANRAPFGPGVRGIGAASRHYFDKEPAELSAGEAALLAALPKGPAVYDPVRRPERVAARREFVIERMKAAGFLSADAARLAAAEPTTALRAPRAPDAIHFVEALLGAEAFGPPPRTGVGRATVASTIDAALQAEVEHAIRAHLSSLDEQHVTAAAALVVDNATGEILAYVGSPDPFDAAHGGFNDGVRARRQAGSTLKPFLYGRAFDRREIDAASMLADVPLTIPLPSGSFVPGNYDGKFHGPVRARVALGSSLNVPAVALAERVGTLDYLRTLREAGFDLPDGPDHYGAALALGDGEVTLLELVAAYAGLARGGERVRLRAFQGSSTPEPGDAAHFLSARAAWLVGDILADKEARLPSFGEGSVLELPFRASVKTGTSKGFRDNWAIGSTDRVTAGVWAGNFDGTPMHDVSGVAGAGPILRSVLIAAEAGAMRSDLPEPPPGLVRAAVCPLSGAAPTEHCTHVVQEWVPREIASGREKCKMHVDDGIAYPAELLAWARASGRPLARARDSTEEATYVRIEQPVTDAHYYVEQGRADTIGVRVRAPHAASFVALQVDGREVARGRPGEILAWRPTVGTHALIASAGGPPSEPVTVTIE
jgi:penicillin-binding protein 1C